jgi:HEAT repeat protein
MDLVTYLERVGAENHRLAMRDLKPLSDLEPGQRQQFLEGWRAINADRRLEITRSMVELSEDNVDLHFSQVLLWCLEDSEASVRVAAAEGLWESENPRVMRRLVELLRSDPAPVARSAVALVLSRFAYMAEMGELDDDDAERLRKALVSTVNDTSQPIEVRRRALESAGYYASDEEAQRLVASAYDDSDDDMKEGALVAMGRSMLPHWIPVIERELESRSPAMRYEAARAAGELSDEGRPLVVRVARLLGDSDTEVALAAIWALGQIGGEAATRALKQVQSRSESEARVQAATDALAELSLGDGLLGEARGFPRPGGRAN